MRKKIRIVFEGLARNFATRFFFRALGSFFHYTSKSFGFFYVRATVRLPSGSNCHWSTQFKYPTNISFSGPVMISPYCTIGAKAPVSLGNRVRLSQGVHIETASLDLNSGLPYQHIAKPITIEDGVWIGAHSIILGGVTIGENAVVGAGVVVSNSIPPGGIVVGKGNRFIHKKGNYSE
jgi:maltose O-acetyltransferase